MFIKLNGFKKMIKTAYDAGCLHVMNTGGDYVLYGPAWYICIDSTKMPNKAKGAVIELIGEWPEQGEAFQAGKEMGNQMEMIEDETYWLATSVKTEEKLVITPVVLHGTIRLMKKDGALVPFRESVLGMVGAEYCEEKETGPEGPFLSNGMTWWKNEDMFFGYTNIELAEESEDGILVQKLKTVM